VSGSLTGEGARLMAHLTRGNRHRDVCICYSAAVKRLRRRSWRPDGGEIRAYAFMAAGVWVTTWISPNGGCLRLWRPRSASGGLLTLPALWLGGGC